MLILEIFQYLLKKKTTHPCNKLISIINLYFCLLQTDNSTETFWESGDEDRNKTKTVTVTCFMKAYPKAIYVHVDNTRDVAVSFSSPLSSHILISCIIFRYVSLIFGPSLSPFLSPLS